MIRKTSRWLSATEYFVITAIIDGQSVTRVVFCPQPLVRRRA